MKKAWNQAIEPRGLTREQAASYLGVPVATFVRAAEERGIQPIRIGNRTRYDLKAIDRAFFINTDDSLHGRAEDWTGRL